MEATSLALFYNRELLKRAGLDPDRPPADWNQLREDAKKLTVDRDGDGKIDQYGFFVPVFPASGELNIWMTLQWTTFLWQAGGSEISPDQSSARFNSEAGNAALTLWKTIYDEEDFSRFSIAHDLGFASEKLAIVMDGPWNLPRYRAMKGIDWAVAPLPAGPAGRATYLAGEQLAIFKNSPHPAEAWAFVRWILQPSVQAQFSMASGYLPVRRSVLAMAEYCSFLARDPALKAFVEQMHEGRARAHIDRHHVEINRALAEAIEEATLGKGDPKECLDRAAAKANALLNERSPTGNR
jgi:multiple sugar transport system substrate-binding protein